jgi:hypothetical protein
LINRTPNAITVAAQVTGLLNVGNREVECIRITQTISATKDNSKTNNTTDLLGTNNTLTKRI